MAEDESKWLSGRRAAKGLADVEYEEEAGPSARIQVIDRQRLVLNIFALRAYSKIARSQVLTNRTSTA